jgi:hypothetical protein
MKYFLIFVAGLLVFSCNTKKDEETNEETVVEEFTDTASKVVTTPPLNPETRLYIWRATPDYEKVKNENAQPAILTVDSLIKGLNEYYANVYLEKVKQSSDTLYTRIADSRFLANQMGSTGAEIYIADVVLNLTSVSGVKYVHVDMEEGSHAQPGTWSAANFNAYKEKKP